MAKQSATTEANLIERPPVVVIMGHIDHGKSTLLDYIRKARTKIVDGEFGGITQHITAYEVVQESEGKEKKITFIDTPGHAAFSSVRNRGAQIADIAILIVSAEDGVMPQTKEALETILGDGMPYIVAINKIDSPKASIEKTQSSLIENGVYLEGLGGQVPFVNISAKTGDGIPELIDMILLMAEVEDLKADSNKNAEGIVIEAHKDMKKGVSSTLIIKDGTLKKGQFIAVDSSLSPVRNIESFDGSNLSEASFSLPITISGWNNVPKVGQIFKCFDNKKEAEKYCNDCLESLDNSKNSTKNTSDKMVNIPLIIKTDVIGTAEAIIGEIQKIDIENVGFNIVNYGTGNISETDMKLALANPQTIVVGFNVATDPQAEALREREEIKTKTFNIIYELTDYLKESAISSKPRIKEEQVVGTIKILKIFNKDKNNQVIGAKVKTGEIKKGQKFKIMRRNENIGMGTIKGLQSQKVVVDNIKEGTEFGGAVESKIELAMDDHLEVFEIIER